MNSAATIIRRDPSEKRYPYHKVFLGGALLYFLAVLPFLIYHGGIFFYYGDYNVQQVPFYILAHRAVRSGNFFWSFKVDLGSPMAGSFAFYLWGSPFFWLSCLFPEKWVPRAHGAGRPCRRLFVRLLRDLLRQHRLPALSRRHVLLPALSSLPGAVRAG